MARAASPCAAGHFCFHATVRCGFSWWIRSTRATSAIATFVRRITTLTRRSLEIFGNIFLHFAFAVSGWGGLAHATRLVRLRANNPCSTDSVWRVTPLLLFNGRIGSITRICSGGSSSDALAFRQPSLEGWNTMKEPGLDARHRNGDGSIRQNCGDTERPCTVRKQVVSALHRISLAVL